VWNLRSRFRPSHIKFTLQSYFYLTTPVSSSRLHSPHPLGGGVGSQGPESEPHESPRKTRCSEKIGYHPPADHIQGHDVSGQPVALDVETGDKGLENNNSSPNQSLRNGDLGVGLGMSKRRDIFGKFVIVWGQSMYRHV
jgi:hypothetical protein